MGSWLELNLPAAVKAHNLCMSYVTELEASCTCIGCEV